MYMQKVFDAFEGDDYVKTPVDVVLEGGVTKKALVYVW